MTLKPHRCTKKKLHAKLNKMCHTYFIASSTFCSFLQLAFKSLGRYDCLSDTCGTAAPTLNLPPAWVSSDRRATTRETDALKGTVHLKRPRTEAPWNFTKNPLGVTKALTIPWEFINKQKSRQKTACKSPSRTTAHFPHCFQMDCCIN